MNKQEVNVTGSQPVDVVIVGGGLVGGSLAACLARDPSLHIVVVEKISPQRLSDEALQHPSYDARNTALANGTCHLFDQLGLWQTLRQQAEAIERIVVCDRGGFGRSVINASDENVRALGYIVENRWVGEVLTRHLESLPNVTVMAPAEVTACCYQEQSVDVEVTRETVKTQLQTPLLVIADGAQSNTRQLLGIATHTEDYGQTAVVTTLTPDCSHNNQAWERFTETGPLALLPQTDNRYGVTWCLESAQAKELLAVSDADFLEAIQKAAGQQMGHFIHVGQRFGYPLKLTLSDEQVRPRCVVLGNSAHALHPVAGQGLNLSIRDVAALTQLIYKAREQGQDYGELGWLNHYFEKRKHDQAATVQFSDKVVKLFSNNKRGYSLARNAGLIAFDLMPGAKRFLAHYAMGRATSTRLPEPPQQNHQSNEPLKEKTP